MLQLSYSFKCYYRVYTNIQTSIPILVQLYNILNHYMHVKQFTLNNIFTRMDLIASYRVEK